RGIDVGGGRQGAIGRWLHRRTVTPRRPARQGRLRGNFGAAPLPSYHRARARPHLAHLVGPTHDLEPAVEMLDDDAAALDPIAALHVANAEIVVNRGVMDVAANHPVNRVAARFLGKGALEFADIVHGVLDPSAPPIATATSRESRAAGVAH